MLLISQNTASEASRRVMAECGLEIGILSIYKVRSVKTNSTQDKNISNTHFIFTLDTY